MWSSKLVLELKNSNKVEVKKFSYKPVLKYVDLQFLLPQIFDCLKNKDPTSFSVHFWCLYFGKRVHITNFTNYLLNKDEIHILVDLNPKPKWHILDSYTQEVLFKDTDQYEIYKWITKKVDMRFLDFPLYIYKNSKLVDVIQSGEWAKNSCITRMVLKGW